MAGQRRNNCRVHEKGLLAAGQTAKITKVIKFKNCYAQKGIQETKNEERGLSCQFFQKTLKTMLMQRFCVQTRCIMVPLI